MPIPVVLDVDTGTDDALAILYAVAHPDLDVRAISCVAGNSGVAQVVTNTLKVLDAADAPQIPVAAGASWPLIERRRPDAAFHGLDGLGGIALPDTARQPSSLHAVDLLHTTIAASSEPVTLVALAPQTNLALLLAQHPGVVDNLERIVFMGGSAGVGNVTAVAEFNVWQDPESAAAVVESGVPISMYGLDVFLRVRVGQAVADRLRGAANPALRLAGELLHRRGARSDGSHRAYQGIIGDAGALVFLTDSELFAAVDCPVRVNLAGLGRGQTIVDRRTAIQDGLERERDPWPTVRVALDVDAPAAAERFVGTIGRLAP